MITPVQINAAIAKAKKEKANRILAVDKGLYLRITSKGSALWSGKVKFKNKTHNASFGHFPKVSLIEARRLKEDWEEQIKGDCVMKSYTLEDAFNDWWERQKNNVVSKTDHYAAKNHLLPKLGHYQLKNLTAFQCIRALQYLEDERKYPTLRVICSILRRVSIFVQNTGRVENMHDLTHISANYARTTPIQHRKAVAPDHLVDVFCALETKANCKNITFKALMAIFYTLSRCNEICSMRWDWVDLENDVIHFPAEIMKRRIPHDVPISRQLKALLLSLERKNDFVFPSIDDKAGHIHAKTPPKIFNNIKYNGTQTVHGIRSVGSSWFAENGVNEEVAEACLAHASGSAVRRAYQRSELLEKRRPVMQAWCDYVEQCHNTAIDKINK